MNERRIELGLSLVELDNAATQAAGTAAKYLSLGQVRTLGVESLFRLAGTLGLRLVLEIDQTATALLLERSRQRHENQARMGNFAQVRG